MEKKTFTTFEIAEYCQVTDRTVLGWVESGKLKGYRTPGRHSRVKISDFLDFLNQYNMPVPEELEPFLKRPKRVLIVDDDVALAEAIKRSLTKEKYEIQMAHDGFAAGEIFSDFKPDLIILDIKMPKMDGFEVCSRIRSNQKNDRVKIIAISANTDSETVEKIKKLGANEFVGKPFEKEDLLLKIKEMISPDLSASKGEHS